MATSVPFRRILFACLLPGMFPPTASCDDRIEFFERRIRPILVDHCYECHSGQVAEPESGLRLDTRDGARAGGNSGRVIVPGKPDESLLMSAVRYESLEMPPNRKLPEHAIVDLRRWIQDGAVDPRDDDGAIADRVDVRSVTQTHWAFQQIRRPALPPDPGDRWSRTAIDRLIHAQLRRADLSPAPEAPRRTLIRRAYYDLTGLPPSPREFQAVLHDPSADWYPRMIDRLLASPRYGERWGRYWLDLARYADNKGYVFYFEKQFPWAWTYRDYVIRALNEDLPYDQFVRQQLAADQLPSSHDRMTLAAMGFLTVGPRFVNNLHDVIDDQIDVVSRGLLGLTLTCARCHDHKFDPLTQADYYGMYGIFRSVKEPLVLPELTVQDTDSQTPFATGLTERHEQVQQFLDERHQLVRDDAKARMVDYLMAAYQRRHHPPSDDFMLLIQPGELFPVVIERWQRYLKQAASRNDAVWSTWHAYAALPEVDFERAAAHIPVELADDDVHPVIRDAFDGKTITRMQDVATIYAKTMTALDQVEDDALTTAQADLRTRWRAADSPVMVPREWEWGYFHLIPDRDSQAVFKERLKALEEWMMKQPDAPPRAMVVAEREQPFDPFVFIRGNPTRRGVDVRRDVPQLLRQNLAHRATGGAVDRNDSGRLAMAENIVRRDNPLTARVIVNRLWQHHFGHGLVRTPSDFGLRSDPPSHPALLDWLAVELMEQGWSIKSMHRLMMTSSVYRQASQRVPSFTKRAARLDPENRWLWKFPRRRLDFEALRDTLLAVSDRIDLTMRGPSVDLLAEDIPRRTVYAYIDRFETPVLLRTFDFPSTASTSAQRIRTIVAPQSLYFLNNPFVQTAARHVVQRADMSVVDPDARLDQLFTILLSRTPDKVERQSTLDFLHAAETDETTERWQEIAHALMMTNEFVFID